MIVFLCLVLLSISNGNVYAENIDVQKDIKNVSTEQSPHGTHFGVKVDEGDTDHFMHEFINMLTTLGIIVAFVLIATWFLKKMFNTRIEQLNTNSVVKVIERRVLNPKTTIFLLEIKGRGLIVAESANGLTHLGDFDVGKQT